MNGKESYRFHREADNIWKGTRMTFQELLVQFYKQEKKKFRRNNRRGILVDLGTPHQPALRLNSDGTLKWVQSPWTPGPFEDREISDMEFCTLATEIMEKSPKAKNPPKTHS